VSFRIGLLAPRLHIGIHLLKGRIRSLDKRIIAVCELIERLELLVKSCLYLFLGLSVSALAHLKGCLASVVADSLGRRLV